MATNQAQRPEAEVSEKMIKAALEELIIKNGERKEVDDLKGQIVTNGFLVNGTGKELMLAGKIDWHGRVTSPYPHFFYPTDPFPVEYETFTHSGPTPGGSKGGFVYKDIANTRQWIVAFDTLKVKAYIETGGVGPVNWKAVEKKLNASGSRSECGESYCYHIPGSLFSTVFRPIGL